MTRLNLDLKEILGDRYDIEMKDYFKLSVEERNYLAKYLVSKIFITLIRNRESLPLYQFLLQDRLFEIEFNQEYELADLYQRIINEINLIYSPSVPI
jgi:hypothetical protein